MHNPSGEGSLANILIVEDDPEIADAVAALLTPAGHVTRTARNGVEGLRMVAEQPPDLILLDVEMPILDGPRMAEALAMQRAGLPRMPIVIVSAARSKVLFEPDQALVLDAHEPEPGMGDIKHQRDDRAE
jgi:CheY-like chemotaxis protein